MSVQVVSIRPVSLPGAEISCSPRLSSKCDKGGLPSWAVPDDSVMIGFLRIMHCEPDRDCLGSVLNPKPDWPVRP